MLFGSCSEVQWSIPLCWSAAVHGGFAMNAPIDVSFDMLVDSLDAALVTARRAVGLPGISEDERISRPNDRLGGESCVRPSRLLSVIR